VSERLPSVSAVVATTGRRDTLEHCVHAVLADPALSELVVVVDGPHEAPLAAMRALAASDPRVLAVQVPAVGALRAREHGVRRARGDVVLLLDDDVIAREDLPTRHARRHAARTDLVVVGYMPVRVPAERRPGQAAVRLYAEEYERACERYEQAPSRILDGLWMGNVSLRREPALRVGLFSPAFGAIRYHEDQELGLRLRDAGLVGVFDRALRADHFYERSLASFAAGARSQGEGLVALHALHPAALGPLSPARFEVGLPALARAFVRLARRPRGGALASAGLLGLAQAAGRLHLWRVETAAARLLRRVEQQRGALVAVRPP